MKKRLSQAVEKWLTDEKLPPEASVPLYNFERTCRELRPCDVILVEGRSRVSEVIRQITQSPWSHACLYIGRLHDIPDPEERERLRAYGALDPNKQYIIESYLGKGTILSHLDTYQLDHLRICRPAALSHTDAQKVVCFAINKLGTDYDVRQILDLARLLFPWSILPRRWRSSLFESHVGPATRTVCSTMIAEAFSAVHFPILPVVRKHKETGVELFHRNPRLFTPRDFDYSPYFEIVKYPYIAFSEGPYRNLPWNAEGLMSQDGETIYYPTTSQPSSWGEKTRKIRFYFKIKKRNNIG